MRGEKWSSSANDFEGGRWEEKENELLWDLIEPSVESTVEFSDDVLLSFDGVEVELSEEQKKNAVSERTKEKGEGRETKSNHHLALVDRVLDRAKG